MKEVYEPDHQTGLKCKDCNFETNDASEFSEHVHSCPVNPVKMPDAEVARRSGIVEADYPSENNS